MAQLTFFQPNPGPDRPCPNCGRPRPHSPRYPDAICADCVERAVDAAGRRLSFANATLTGGLSIRYVDTGESTDSDLCFIDGRPCRVREARFGGIVVQPIDRSAPAR